MSTDESTPTEINLPSMNLGAARVDISDSIAVRDLLDEEGDRSPN